LIYVFKELHGIPYKVHSDCGTNYVGVAIQIRPYSRKKQLKKVSILESNANGNSTFPLLHIFEEFRR